MSRIITKAYLDNTSEPHRIMGVYDDGEISLDCWFSDERASHLDLNNLDRLIGREVGDVWQEVQDNEIKWIQSWPVESGYIG